MEYKVPLIMLIALLLIGNFTLYVCTRPVTMTYLSHDETTSFSVGPCNESFSSTKSQGTDDFDYTVSNNTLHIFQNLKYVCCADVIVTSQTFEGYTRKLIKINEINRGSICKCLCSYDVNVSVSNLSEGDYTVQVFGVAYKDQPASLKWENNFTVELDSTQLANPASVNCINKGGKMDIREDENGGQYGVCMFSDGSECEEWAFFRGDCNMSQKRLCDATITCPEGTSCYKFQDEFAPTCVAGDPCSKCTSGQCMATTSYPSQISCI